MQNRNIGKLASILAVVGMMVGAESAKATLTFTLSSVFNGATPASVSPWLTATFEDNGSGGVNLTLFSALNVASEYIDEVAFNIRPDIDPASVTVTTDANAPIATTISHTTQNGQNLGGAGTLGTGFDFRIQWDTANAQNGIDRFNGSEVDSFTFTFVGLTEADFNYANTGGAGAHFAAHINGITVGNSGAIRDSDFTPVPEPSTMIAGGLLLLPFALSTLRMLRRKRTA